MYHRENKAYVSSVVIVVGTMLAIVYHYSRFAFIPDYGPKPDSFLHYQINIFCDFYSLFDSYVRLGFKAPINYLPSIYLPLEALAKINQNNPYLSIRYVLIFYMILYYIFIVRTTAGINYKDRCLFVVAILLFNYPVIFTLHTGNFEFICFLLIAYAIIFSEAQHFFFSGLMIGVSASIKIYPIIYVFSVINRSNYKSILSGILVGVFVPLVLVFSLHGDYVSNYNSWLSVANKGYENYRGMMIESYNGVFFGHSLINAFRVIVGPGYDMKPVFIYYYPVAALMGIISIIACIKAKGPAFKILIIASFISLFAPTSQDYKLLYFIIPLVYFVRDVRADSVLYYCVIMLSLLLIPKSYYRFYGSDFVTINTLINAVVISLLFVMGLYESKVLQLGRIK